VPKENLMTFVDRIFMLALIALPQLAAAQPHTDQSNVAAESLFREGKRLMKDGKIAEACDKLAASDRLDDSVGTLLNLADCREKNDQLATAWATFLRAASIARASNDSGREAEAHKRASALEPRLAYLTISVPQSSHVDGLIIKRNTDVIDAALWNQGVPVDIGAYEISGQAPGHEPWSTRVQVSANGARTSVEVPRFKQLKDLTTVAVPSAPAPEPEEAEPVTAPPPTLLTPLRIGSIVAAGVGVVALGTGSGFGLEAKHLQKLSNAICPATTCGDAHAMDLNRRARNDALASNILFGVGGAAVVGAAVVWFVGAPHPSETVSFAPVVGRGQLGLALEHAF
jgi:hypothetical protein